ncbi:hypothetical protein OZN62_00110 [Aurantiacibacter sp. MUD11]|uniref:hypothetical protein n=1 Tax=Aurantiacibacter sp. MUD11 TaxID=3003265 RepID=UPI0022AA8312|nr:hypothetical protein [Aurantiacibacter sp. MUD11]WAT18018.1 hypothetical protein OZN62_00110 [Aurantiacibacter sp. MUD11]
MNNRKFQLLGLASALLAAAGLAVPAQAQFGGFGSIVNEARRAAERDREPEPEPEQSQTPEECAQDSSPSVGRRILGGLLGDAANDAARRAGLPTYVPVGEFSDQISTAIACQLDPDEQRQAAEATVEATRGAGEDGGAEVGSTSAWVSETRDGVSGRSTVTGRDTAPGQNVDCITVSDVIIVGGEETRDEKRMCRRPPSPRYSIAA